MKRSSVLLITIISILIISFVVYYNINQSTEIIPDADWASHYDNINDLIKNSGIIIKGKVIDSKPEQRVDLIFTMQEVKIEKVYYGEIKEGDTVSVLQTGGELNGKKTTPFREAPIWNKGDEYLLFLEHTDEGHYLVLGGYQGAGRIENNKVKFSKVKNDNIAKEFSNKKLLDIESYISQIINENYN